MSGDERNARAYRAISGKSPRTEPNPAPTTLDFHGSLDLLYGRVKSQSKLADMLGVPRRTLRRWLAGETPTRTGTDRQRRALVEDSAKRLIKVDDQAAITAVRRGRLSARREAQVRGGTTVVVKAWMRYGHEPDQREIMFRVGSTLRPGALDNLVDLYLNGATADDGPEVQNEGVFAAIIDGMTDGKYKQMFEEREPDALAFDVTRVTIR